MGSPSPQSSSARPVVSVVVPFRGDSAEARLAAEALALMDLLDEDEILLADESTEETAGAGDQDPHATSLCRDREPS